MLISSYLSATCMSGESQRILLLNLHVVYNTCLTIKKRD